MLIVQDPEGEAIESTVLLSCSTSMLSRQSFVLRLPSHITFLTPRIPIPLRYEPPITITITITIQPSMISKILLLVKEIRPRAAQVDNLRTPVPVLFQPRTLEAVEGVRDALDTYIISLSLYPIHRIPPPGEKEDKGTEKRKLTSPPHTTHLFW